ncbi:MAG: head-tail joining protein [Oligoflexus sp.]
MNRLKSDLARIFNDKVFGDEAKIIPKSGETPYTVRGVFDVGYSDEAIKDRYVVQSKNPVFLGREEDLATVRAKDQLAFNQKVYEVSSIKKDQLGVKKLELTARTSFEEREEHDKKDVDSIFK